MYICNYSPRRPQVLTTRRVWLHGCCRRRFQGWLVNYSAPGPTACCPRAGIPFHRTSAFFLRSSIPCASTARLVHQHTRTLGGDERQLPTSTPHVCTSRTQSSSITEHAHWQDDTVARCATAGRRTRRVHLLVLWNALRTGTALASLRIRPPRPRTRRSSISRSSVTSLRSAALSPFRRLAPHDRTSRFPSPHVHLSTCILALPLLLMCRTRTSTWTLSRCPSCVACLPRYPAVHTSVQQYSSVRHVMSIHPRDDTRMIVIPGSSWGLR
ncbi:hypothetical protein B0H14DRAFT_659166 [Mycena olivaceomarginata]|nr:hypothetical protein B0H14DRAFT_659166 [Mycena olivaceomarginata]